MGIDNDVNGATHRGQLPAWAAICAAVVMGTGVMTGIGYAAPSGGGLTAVESPLPMGEVAVAYPRTALVGGGTEPYVVTATGDPLPPGLMLDAAKGTLSGTPTAEGSYTIAIDAQDSAGGSLQATFEVTIASLLVITTEELPAAAAGQCFTATVVASGGVPPFTWTMAPPLPRWASTTDNSTLSGCPTERNEGSSTHTFTVVDSLGGRASRELRLAVVTAAATPTPTAMPTPTALPSCIGDCNANRAVTIDELITLVNIALGAQPPTACTALPSGEAVTIAMLVSAVGSSLTGCVGG